MGARNSSFFIITLVTTGLSTERLVYKIVSGVVKFEQILIRTSMSRMFSGVSVYVMVWLL